VLDADGCRIPEPAVIALAAQRKKREPEPHTGE
jgi:hypothetical protein